MIKYNAGGQLIGFFGVGDADVLHNIALAEDLDLLCVADRENKRSTIICVRRMQTRQSQTADTAPGVATWEVTLNAQKVVPCVRWPATGIAAHSL